jgi:cytochrome c-type biogenesis protein CcmH
VRLARFVVAGLLICVLDTGWAVDSQPAFQDPALQARYERITRELRCLQCRSETIADSNAPLAADLRRKVHDMLADGRSDADIRQFMLDRYGDFVLYRPRMTARNLLLWTAPALLLLIGSGVAVVFIRRRTRDIDEDDIESGAGPA